MLDPVKLSFASVGHHFGLLAKVAEPAERRHEGGAVIIRQVAHLGALDPTTTLHIILTDPCAHLARPSVRVPSSVPIEDIEAGDAERSLNVVRVQEEAELGRWFRVLEQELATIIALLRHQQACIDLPLLHHLCDVKLPNTSAAFAAAAAQVFGD